MLTKIFVTLFAFILVISSSNFAIAQTNDQRIKADVAKRGTGEKARLTVTTKTGVKSKGYITRADADNFELRNEKTLQTETFNYNDVAKVQKPGWSKAAKIGLGIGIGVAVAAVVLTVAMREAFDNFGPFAIGTPNQ